ncbi:MAG: outer membrane protein assembly factor BamE [Steroidobacteraceae bacterium]
MRQTHSPDCRAQRPLVQRLLATIAVAGVLALATGCLYRMPIQQGNYLDPTQAVQLQAGMTKSQVRFLLGTPILPSGFNADRWNYFYYRKDPTVKTPFSRQLTVYFKDDKVDHFDLPADAAAAAAAMSAAAAAPVSDAPLVKPGAPPVIPEARRTPRR